jgi:hypothetical protein
MLNLRRSFVFFAVLLGLLTVGIASANGGGKEKAKNYEITVGSPTRVGTVVLKPGDYKFKVEGSNAIFTKSGSDTTFTTPAKIETGTENFDRTMIHQIQDGGQARIISIVLKGTQNTLKFD